MLIRIKKHQAATHLASVNHKTSGMRFHVLGDVLFRQVNFNNFALMQIQLRALNGDTL